MIKRGQSSATSVQAKSGRRACAAAPEAVASSAFASSAFASTSFASTALAFSLAIASLALSGCATVKEYIPTIPAPSFRWLYDSEETGALARVESLGERGHKLADPGGTRDLDSLPPYCPMRSMQPPRMEPLSVSTLRMVAPSGVSRRARDFPAGRRRRDTGRGWNCKRRRAGLFPGRKACMDCARVHRSRCSSACCRRRRHRVHGRRQPECAQRQRWLAQMGQSAGDTRAHRAQLCRRHCQARRPVRRDRRRPFAYKWTSLPELLGWDGTVANPKGSTELERIADVTSMPLALDKDVCAIAYQGRVACFDMARGTLSWSRDISPDSATWRRTPRTSISPTTRDSCRRWIAPPAHRYGSRICSRCARSAGRKMVGERRRRRCGGLLAPALPVNGAYVGRRLRTARAPRRSPGLLLTGALWRSTAGTLLAVSRQVARRTKFETCKRLSVTELVPTPNPSNIVVPAKGGDPAAFVKKYTGVPLSYQNERERREFCESCYPLR